MHVEVDELRCEKSSRPISLEPSLLSSTAHALSEAQSSSAVVKFFCGIGKSSNYNDLDELYTGEELSEV